MTLTTEQLRARAKFWREKAVEAKWESVSIAQDMLQNADAFDELAANREAQPVYQFIYNNPHEEGYTEWLDCNKDYFNGVPKDCRRILYTTPPAPSGEVVVTRNERGDIVTVTRQDGEGRVIEVIAESNAPPAPAVPEEMTGGIAMSKYKVKKSNYVQWVKGFNACRAAMLAAAPEGGNG
ncbi:hypothetical protein I5K90_08690 [Serratia marcescens]|nr:hypothetical protein [Serratia marcescens]